MTIVYQTGKECFLTKKIIQTFCNDTVIQSKKFKCGVPLFVIKVNADLVLQPSTAHSRNIPTLVANKINKCKF